MPSLEDLLAVPPREARNPCLPRPHGTRAEAELDRQEEEEVVQETECAPPARR